MNKKTNLSSSKLSSDSSSNSSFLIKGKGLDKKSIVCFSIIIIEVVLILFGIFSLYKEMENTNTALILEEQVVQETKIMDDLTAPRNEETVPQEIIDDLTAPEAQETNEETVPQEIIDSLTAPE